MQDVDCVGLRTSSASVTPQSTAVEPAQEGQEMISGPKDTLNHSSALRDDKGEGDNEHVKDEVLKTRSSIRFRKKSKQPKEQHEKGLWLR